MDTLQFGHKVVWKPVQAGMVLSTTSVLNLCEDLLDDQDFLLTSRLTQDCVENLFSCVRSKNPIPSLHEFKNALKIITVAQYLSPCQHGNYQTDDREYLGDMLSKVIDISHPLSEEVDAVEHNFTHSLQLNGAECDSLYYLAGYCVASLKKLRQICDTCQPALLNTGDVHPNATLVKLKNFKDGALYEVSYAVFDLFKQWEGLIRSVESNILAGYHSTKELFKSVGTITCSPELPTCHPILERLSQKFITVRLHILCKKIDNSARSSSSSSSTPMGSKSTAQHHLVRRW